MGGGADHGHGHGHGEAHGDFRTKVWSMSGGPYCRPKHWRRNTAIAMAGVFLICIPIAMKSAELEVFSLSLSLSMLNFCLVAEKMWGKCESKWTFEFFRILELCFSGQRFSFLLVAEKYKKFRKFWNFGCQIIYNLGLQYLVETMGKRLFMDLGNKCFVVVSIISKVVCFYESGTCEGLRLGIQAS